MNIQDWFPWGWTGWISLQSKGLSRVFSNTTVQKHQFFIVQLSYSYMITGKTKVLTGQTFVGKVMCLLFNILSRLVIAGSVEMWWPTKPIAESVHACLTLCNPMDYSLPGSSVQGILQARIFWILGSNPCLLCLLNWQAGALPLAPSEEGAAPLTGWGYFVHACVNAPIQECAFLASSQGKLMLSFLGPPLSTTVIFLFVLFSHKLCPTLCDPMDYSLPGFLCPWNFPGKNTEGGCYFLLQGIFLTQGSNAHLWHLLHGQVDSEPLSHLGSQAKTMKWSK